MPGRTRSTWRCSRRVERHVAWILRTGAHQAHLATQHIDQLRQFIELGSAEEGATARDPAVARGCDARTLLVGIGDHAAELVEAKRDAIPADARRPIEHRSPANRA